MFFYANYKLIKYLYLKKKINVSRRNCFTNARGTNFGWF